MKSKEDPIILLRKRSTLTLNECTVCGSAQNGPFYAGLVKCMNCGHVFADIRLTENELFGLYGRSYFFGDEYCDYVADREVLQKNFRVRLRALEPFLQPERHKHLFEIGCAYGFFLDTARDRFETIQGIDISKEGITYAREQLGLNVVLGDLLKESFRNSRFDVVCIWDTIEHLQQPHLYIEKIAGMTEKDALLTVTTGDIGSLNAHFKKGKWRLIHPPSHLHYFSKDTLSRLLNRYGFDVLYQKHCGFYRSLDHMAFTILVLRKNKRWLYDLFKKTPLAKLWFYLNFYDIVYTIAKKR
jgi:SAM-dependent methyltransferase